MYPQQNIASEREVLNEAVVNAAHLLNLKQIEVSEIIGPSTTEISRLFKLGKASIAPNTKNGQCAILFLRAFRSLYTILGEDQEQCQEWFKNYNYHLQGIPLDLAKRPEGLAEIVAYLDAMRGLA